jgi:hypothetical protein
MNLSELEKNKKIVQESAILSSVEKAEWIQLLPEMNDKQVADLLLILQPKPKPAPIVPFVPPVPKAAPPSPHAPLNNNQPKVNIAQKEISTSVPFYELEIPAHTGVSPAPTDPTELQNRVEQIVKELQQKKDYTTPHPLPAPSSAPAPSQRPIIQTHVESHPLVLTSVEDFAKIEAKNIHGIDPNVELQKILSYMVEVGKKKKVYEVIENFEKSPLYRSYMQMGTELLNNPDPDRDSAYAAVITNFQNRNQQWLTKEEFEAFTDFRKRLDQMV